MRHIVATLTALLLITSLLYGQSAGEAAKRSASQRLQADTARWRQTAMAIWGYAEVGYKEERSSALLAGQLEREGFRMEKGVAGIPTAFVATYGSGSPVIGHHHQALVGVTHGCSSGGSGPVVSPRMPFWP